MWGMRKVGSLCTAATATSHHPTPPNTTPHHTTPPHYTLTAKPSLDIFPVRRSEGLYIIPIQAMCVDQVSDDHEPELDEDSEFLDEAGESLPVVTHYLCLAVRSRGGTVTSELLKVTGFYVNRRKAGVPAPR